MGTPSATPRLNVWLVRCGMVHRLANGRDTVPDCGGRSNACHDLACHPLQHGGERGGTCRRSDRHPTLRHRPPPSAGTARSLWHLKRDRYGTSSEIHIDSVVTAALTRARQTAAIAFEDSHFVITADARLNECDYGTLSGRPRVEIDSARSAHVEMPWPGGESYLDAVTRHRAAFDDIERERPDGTVLVVGHYATWMALEHLANGRPITDVALEGRAWRSGWRYEYRGSWGAA